MIAKPSRAASLDSAVYCRVSNGDQVSRVASLAMKRGKSVDFTGYWQRLGLNAGLANRDRRQIAERWNRGVNPFFFVKECYGGLFEPGLNQHRLQVGDSRRQ